MIDLRPVGYVIGLMVVMLGLTMLAPMGVDMLDGQGHWPVFAQSAMVTTLIGAVVALSCQSGTHEGLTLQQTFILTTGVWVALPIFGAMASQTVFNLVDTAMVGRLGPQAIAGVGIGSFLAWLSATIVIGMSAGVQASGICPSPAKRPEVGSNPIQPAPGA